MNFSALPDGDLPIAMSPLGGLFGGSAIGSAAWNLNPVSSVEGLSVLAHLGVFDMQHASSVTDYSIGVGYNFGKVATTLKYIDGSHAIRGASNSIDNHVVLAVSTTLPWTE